MPQPTLQDHPTDIASLSHWESVWQRAGRAPGFSALNYYDFRLARMFQPLVPPGARVVEIGCGGSRWIKYFAGKLQRETWGIDYSPEGLAITEKDNAGNPLVHLVAGDFFAHAPP